MHNHIIIIIIIIHVFSCQNGVDFFYVLQI